MKGWMMGMFWTSIVVQIVIRAVLTRGRKNGSGKTGSSAGENVLLLLLTLAQLVLPLVYSATEWLSFANYTLAPVFGWLGLLLLVGSLVLFWRSHYDLGSNWSPTLEVSPEQNLVTSGVYSLVRHPMYSSQLLFSLAQPLLLQNWIAGGLNFVVFVVFFVMRAGAEEAMMRERFGQEYAAYSGRSKRLIPWVW